MKEEKNNIIAIRLKELRENLNLSQEEFSKKVNLSNQTICNYENGRKIPTIDIVFNIAETFNVSIDWLCGRVEEKEVSFNGIESMEFKTYSDIIKCLLKFPDLRIKEDMVWGKDKIEDINGFPEEIRKTRKVYTLLFENEELQKELYQMKYILELDNNVVKEKDKQKLINAYVKDDFNKVISEKDNEEFITYNFTLRDEKWEDAYYDEFLKTYEVKTELEQSFIYDLIEYLPF